MSFMGGAECSTAGNPLSQFAKHVQDDTSLQHDRLVNRGPNGSVNGFRSAPTNVPQDEMVNNFLHHRPQLPEMPLEQGPMNPMQLGPSYNQRTGPWADEFQNMLQPEASRTGSPGLQFSPDEFAKFRQLKQPASARSSPMPGATAQMSSQAQRPMMGMGMMNNMGATGMGMGMNYSMMGSPSMYQYRQGQTASPLQHQHQQEPEGKGKGKVVELDDHQWEEQFAQIELQDKKLAEVDESQAMEAELNKMDEQILESETGFGDFESIWRGIQNEKAEMRDMTEGESYDEMGWGQGLDGDWDKMGNSRLGMMPTVEPYLFEDENLFKEQTNPFEEGMRIMREKGNLSLAALAFEAAVHKNPDHVEAWVHLGTAQAQNEKEDAAIRALEQAIKLDPNNLDALMGLAVSYTNEGYDSVAYRTLERWLSVKYPQVISPAELSSAAELGFTDRQQLHDKVTQLFIRAAQLSPDGPQMDPDVQVGLGVLCYGAEQYDRAVQCFQAALDSTVAGSSNDASQVHLLWNRLGATLANSGNSEEAIRAYWSALDAHPNFVRARYNLGVSCINVGCHEEAAGHLLRALDMHKSVEREGRERAREILNGPGAAPDPATDERIERMATQNRSTTLYETLRRVFTQMGRRDLAEKVIVGVDPDIFRGEFDF